MNQAVRTRMRQVSRFNPVPDGAAGDLVSEDTLADLAEQITATARDETELAERRRAARRARIRRRLLIGIPVTAAITVAAVVGTVLASPGQKVGPVNVGPGRAQALSFTRVGRYIEVIVRNPVADPATYRAEFAAHHLHISLTLVPVPPDLAGTLVYMGTPANGGGIITITAKGRCTTGSGSNECPVGVKVPIDFHGQADFTFGRAARPGEKYESTNAQTSPGEPLHGLQNGETVSAALAFLRSKHQHVYQFRYLGPGGMCEGNLTQPIPGNWVIQMFTPWSSDQVLLWVGPASGPKRVCTHGAALIPKPSASP